LSPVALQQTARQGLVMEKGGLYRAIFAAALLAGASYGLVGPLGVTGAAAIIWKGSGVALLAVWCAAQMRSDDQMLVAAVMALGALGDVLIETWGLTAGAMAFAAGHVIAMLLYFRNGRPWLTSSQYILSALVVPMSVFIAVTLVPTDARLSVGIYAFLVSAMAASAWISRFPRYRTGIGAMMFLASDLLIFSEMGAWAGSPVPPLLIWPLYFGGQALIAYGVVRTLITEARVKTP
jgi:uncharacterized membrane protein YhhN